MLIFFCLGKVTWARCLYVFCVYLHIRAWINIYFLNIKLPVLYRDEKRCLCICNVYIYTCVCVHTHFVFGYKFACAVSWRKALSLYLLYMYVCACSHICFLDIKLPVQYRDDKCCLCICVWVFTHFFFEYKVACAVSWWKALSLSSKIFSNLCDMTRSYVWHDSLTHNSETTHL